MSALPRVLIVDDEPNVRLVFRTALESDGYVVVEAGDGGRALTLVRAQSFDAILLDLRMPGIDGMEMLRRLACEGVGVPVVVVSAHGSIPDVVAAVRLGAVDFVPKPPAPATLRQAVRLAVTSGRRQSAQSPPTSRAIYMEAVSRARAALERSDCDEADFFVRVARPLGIDASIVDPLARAVASLRQSRRSGEYHVVGGLTWD